jgi:23S rRNA pseudouridine2605 synthase
VLSKRGLCSRTQAAVWIGEGRVRVNGRVVRDPEFPVRMEIDRVDVVGAEDRAPAMRYIALNKPRGLVTSVRDERGRDTVYRCFAGAHLDWIAPVGRLDKASEGLLLCSNDPQWASAITDPARGPSKTYHVQVDRVPDDALLAALVAGITIDGERLAAAHARLLRHGGRNAWIELVLDEGRNRQIRRLLEAHAVSVLRLVRVAVGPVVLGTLEKGAWRELATEEVRALAVPTIDSARAR